MAPNPTIQPPPAAPPAAPPDSNTGADAERREVERAVFERRKPPEEDNPVGPASPPPLGRT